MSLETPSDGTFQQAERTQLLAWIRLGTTAKIAFFEEMVELAYLSGALAPERLALRDWPVSPESSPKSR